MKSRSIPAVLSSLIILSLIFAGHVSDKTHADETSQFGELETLSPMHIPRYNHTHSVIDGSVMITGGTTSGSNSLSSCEILDLDERTWRSVPPMKEERMRHTASVLENGNVMVAGGYVGNGHPSLYRHYSGNGNRSVSSCEVFLTDEERWEAFPSLNVGRFWHSTLNHPSLGILVLGGLNTSHGALSSCEQLTDDGWKIFPSIPEPRARFASCVLENGDIMVAGGHMGIVKNSTDSCFRFDIDGYEWTNCSSMIHPRGYPGYVRLTDGKFMVSGGFSGVGKPDISDSEVYDPDLDSWTEFGDLLFPRHGHGVVEVPGNCLVIAGGSNCQTGGCHSNLEIFQPETGKWVDSGHLIMGRKWCGVSLVGEDVVVVTGGRACNYPTADTEVLTFSHNDNKKESGSDPLAAIFGVVFVISLLLFGRRTYHSRRY